MKIKSSAILIKKLALEFDKIAIPELAPTGLTPSQYKVIKYLFINSDKDIRQRDIEDVFSMTNPTVTGILQNLERDGWINRVENVSDGRSKVLKLTTKSLDKKEELFSIGAKLDLEFTKGLSDSEKDKLNELLNKLFNNIKGGN